MQEEHVAVADGENEVRHTDYIYMVSDKMLVISMIAELDHHLADEMREVIDDVIDVRGVEDIIFDFSRINFMDSAGIVDQQPNNISYYASLNIKVRQQYLVRSSRTKHVCHS